jgi:hypothetical protein
MGHSSASSPMDYACVHCASPFRSLRALRCHQSKSRLCRGRNDVLATSQPGPRDESYVITVREDEAPPVAEMPDVQHDDDSVEDVDMAPVDAEIDVLNVQTTANEASDSDDSSEEDTFDPAWEVYFALSNCNEGQGLSARDFKAVFDVLASPKYLHTWIERFRNSEEFQEWGTSRLVTDDLEWRDESVEIAGRTIPFRMCDTEKVRSIL